MKKVIYLMLVIILSCSCSTNYYAPRNVNQFGTQTQVILKEANFRIVRHVEVIVDVNNSNIKRADIENSAYAELLRRANLTGSQALINVVIEEVRSESTNIFRKAFGLNDVTQHVAARGTIIEFIGRTESPIQTTSPNNNQYTAAPTNLATPTHREPQTIQTTSASQVSQPIPSHSSTQNDNIFVPVTVNSKWITKTKRIAHTYNESHLVEAIYDFNEDGKLSEEELNYINYVLSDSKREPNKDTFYDMAHKNYEGTVLRIKQW